MKHLKPLKIDPKLLRALMTLAFDDQKKAWERNWVKAKAFKDVLDAHLETEQSNRCAYCGSRFMSPARHRDHIAPKGQTLYPQWTFHPYNLVHACYDCNSGWKLQQNTITHFSPHYSKCQFSIIHPYFDDPKEHITYTGHRLSILIYPVKGSAKGKETIRMFDLASLHRTKQRSKDVIWDRDLDHLHGKWRLLAEAVLLSPVPQRLVPRLRG